MLAPNLKSKISSLAHPMGEGRLPSDLSTEALLAKEGPVCCIADCQSATLESRKNRARAFAEGCCQCLRFLGRPISAPFFPSNRRESRRSNRAFQKTPIFTPDSPRIYPAFNRPSGLSMSSASGFTWSQRRYPASRVRSEGTVEVESGNDRPRSGTQSSLRDGPKTEPKLHS